MKLRRALLSLALMAGSSLGISSFAGEGPALLHQMDNAFVEVFERVAPAVVIIESDKKSDDEGGADDFGFFFKDESGKQFRLPQQPTRREGSGFIVRKDGYILTNNHVIADSRQITVKLKDGRQFPAKVHGIDDKSDVAVLKVEANDLPVVEYADSDSVRVGQLVCSIGVPYNLEFSFTCGWVSAKGRAGLTNTFYEDYIQTDAFINPGNSGGPLIDVNSKVIGMNTLINGIGRGLAFAIPSNMLRDVGDQLIATGRVVRPWLGIRMDELTHNTELREHLQGIDRGVVVKTIEPGAPAWKSDLRPTDVITEIDGVPMERASDLQREVLKKRVGQVVKLTVWRAGKTLVLPVTTGELPSEMAKVTETSASPAPEIRADVTGLKLRDVPIEKPKKGEKTEPIAGALVVEIAENSPAARAEVLKDDVITDVDQQPVRDASGCRALLSRADLNRGVLLFLNRKGQKTYAVLRAAE